MVVRQFLTTESPLKMMKNVFFYFMLKALFVLKIFTFLSWLFCYVKKRLDKKFMTSQTRRLIIRIHILNNISKSKDNPAMKFGQLIDYNVINIFLRKSCRK